jgi:hypothetical protein
MMDLTIRLALIRTGDGDGRVTCRCGDVTRLPIGAGQCNSGFAAARLVRDPHGAVEPATSATFLEDNPNLDRLGTGPLARERDLRDRVNPFRNPLEVDHGEGALA